MRIVVTGGSGTIGQELREHLPDARYLTHRECDVTEDVLPALRDAELVIHAAALTDHQHPNPSEVIQTNILGTQRVAMACRTFGIPMVYLSTHYVYAGQTGDYREWHPLSPIGTYAWSKLAGEGWASMAPEYLIIRGSWYTYKTRLRHWEANGALTDAWCSRESASQAAEKIARLVMGGARGVYNIGGPKRTFAQICQDEHLTARPITRADLALPYPFPPDCSVNTEKYDAWAVQ